MFNNVGRCAHIRPIISCKENGYKTDSQRNGLAVATMYGFALYALPERFVLHRFAVVHKTAYWEIKGLIGVVRADLKKCTFRKPEEHIFGRY